MSYAAARATDATATSATARQIYGPYAWRDETPTADRRLRRRATRRTTRQALRAVDFDY